MDYRRFGRTDLQVSVAGLGGGGASRLGLGTGSSPSEAIALVHHALELGINYFDTAEIYETEEIFGRALAGRRDEVILSTKIGPRAEDGSPLDRAGLRRGLVEALRKLRTDFVDVFHLHRVNAANYDYCLSELVPELEELRGEGMLRFVGISESTGSDAGHTMLARAVQDRCWDVVMVAFNLFNQAARETVLPGAIAGDVAIEIMTAARSEFSNEALFSSAIGRLLEDGSLDAGVDGANPLGIFESDGERTSLTAASYRLAAHEPGVHTVLLGTGSTTHLEENVASLAAGPLPGAVHDRLVSSFGHLCLAVQVPGRGLH